MKRGKLTLLWTAGVLAVCLLSGCDGKNTGGSGIRNEPEPASTVFPTLLEQIAPAAA